MTSIDQDQPLTAPRPQLREDKTGDPPPPPSPGQIHVHLVATMNGAKKIDIGGPPGPFPLNVDTGPWLFDFTLTDKTGKGVKFTTLDAIDNRSTCPPTGSGNQSHLIVGDHVDPQDPTKASFTDNNNNRAKDGVVDVSFQWRFTCDDGSIAVGTYDPIVPNGGKTTL